MAKDIHEFRLKLMNKILHASSGMAVVRFIDTAMKVLGEKEVHGHIVVRFIEKIISDLEATDLDTYEPSQQSVINTAIVKFRGLRRKMTEQAVGHD